MTIVRLANPSRIAAVTAVRRAVPLPPSLKEWLRERDLIAQWWTRRRNSQLQREYERRREYYHRRACELRVAYQDDAVGPSVRAHLAARGYTPARREAGAVHTFACIPQISWHKHLLPDLSELGPVTLFDYTALGFSYEEFSSPGRHGTLRRQEMFKLILPALRTAHQRRPVDWVFCYGGGQDTSPAVIRQITTELGIPTVNMSLDDKQGWAGDWLGDCRCGAVDITSAFDLFITSARVACEWHMVEGGRPLYLPEGFDATTFRPNGGVRDIPVSFVGAGYGYRRSVVSHLRRHGVPVTTFGAGWPDAHWVDDMAQVFNRSRVNLGMGGIEYSESLTNLKGRDFEVPGTGGGVYLTSFNPDLARHFVIGSEILCYRNRDELLEQVRLCLAQPEYAASIARAGRERCLREHRWLHRFCNALQLLGVLESDVSVASARGAA